MSFVQHMVLLVSNYVDVHPVVSCGTLRNGTKLLDGFYKSHFARLDGCLAHCGVNLIYPTEHLPCKIVRTFYLPYRYTHQSNYKYDRQPRASLCYFVDECQYCISAF